MTKRDYDVIIKYGKYTVIKYQKQYIGDEYVVAKNFDPENFCWDSASDNYAWSFESALACLLRNLHCDEVKSRNQLRIENNTEMSYDRLCELATLFKDGLLECDEEFALEYFHHDCSMTEEEKSFFGIIEARFNENVQHDW